MCWNLGQPLCWILGILKVIVFVFEVKFCFFVKWTCSGVVCWFSMYSILYEVFIYYKSLCFFSSFNSFGYNLYKRLCQKSKVQANVIIIQQSIWEELMKRSFSCCFAWVFFIVFMFFMKTVFFCSDPNFPSCYLCSVRVLCDFCERICSCFILFILYIGKGVKVWCYVFCC